MTVFLDTGVLGVLTHPNQRPEVAACRAWLEGLLSTGRQVRVPEIADYELRRKLLHLGSAEALRRLELLETAVGYVPITTPAMRRAAGLWATSRSTGKSTSSDADLDADLILVAQALEASAANPSGVVVATTNVRHMASFISAKRWQDI